MDKKKKEKVFDCPVCFKQIKNKLANFRRHLNLHMAEQDRVTCVLCSKTFQTKGNLQVHRKNIHENQDFDQSKTIRSVPGKPISKSILVMC